MAVTETGWPIVSRVLEYVRQQFPEPRRPIKVLSLGYTDYLVSRESIATACGRGVAESVKIRPDGDAIATWHATKSTVIDTDSLYSALGFQTDYLDLAEIRGGELVHNLNDPLPEHLVGRYDFVIDSGTLEHCFNIAQAIANVAMALRVGGFVHHGNPMIMINHGFYNFSPAFYFDFYRANGFELLDMFSVDTLPDSLRIEKLDGVARLKFKDGRERTIQVIARKKDGRPIMWPTQTKYVQNPNLQG